MIAFFRRSCDSRNLNISPFCNLTMKQDPTAWAGYVAELYEAWATDESELNLSYVPHKEKSIRESYPTQYMKENELLTTRPKVYVYQGCQSMGNHMQYLESIFTNIMQYVECIPFLLFVML